MLGFRLAAPTPKTSQKPYEPSLLFYSSSLLLSDFLPCSRMPGQPSFLSSFSSLPSTMLFLPSSKSLSYTFLNFSSTSYLELMMFMQKTTTLLYLLKKENPQLQRNFFSMLPILPSLETRCLHRLSSHFPCFLIHVSLCRTI